MAEGAGKTLPASATALQKLLANGDYVAGRDLATVAWLALTLERPLLLEGESGVGKTELGRVLARVLGRTLIRLQCYEGLDVATAVYDWDYARQMVAIRVAEATGRLAEIEDSLYSRDYLVERPLLRALDEADSQAPPVLLIDEIDRADEPFEAYLLEVLSDYQVTVPELGTVRAVRPPVVVITSNRTRELHDALRRRCLYHWMDYPDEATEARIVRQRIPGLEEQLRAEVTAFVRRLRGLDLYKKPGVAETLDWGRALLGLDAKSLEPQLIDRTLGALIKHKDDLDTVRDAGVERLLGGETA